jgi:hypothetical protein
MRTDGARRRCRLDGASVVLFFLAPSAYLASVASTSELTSALLPPRLRDVKDSGIDAALAACSAKATVPSCATSVPDAPASFQQRAWDDLCCKTQADMPLESSVSLVDRARLLAFRTPCSGDWLEALPLSRIGLKMDNASIRIAVGLRLSAPIVRPHVCVCGTTVTVDGHHGLLCRHGTGRHLRHNEVNDLLCCAFISSGTLASREPHSLYTNSSKRPDGVRQAP